MLIRIPLGLKLRIKEKIGNTELKVDDVFM